MTSRPHDPTTTSEQKGLTVRTLTRMQKAIVTLAILPMIAVGVMGGIGTYSNISRTYGSGTAIGALAAGEGATAVLALLLLGLTMLGQAAPLVIRIGLWALPAAAATMGATAATGIGQTIVYALTPMAITASAEGLAFLVRRIVVHQEGRDVEAEARAAALIRDLAYHQARAAAHPSKRVQKRSVRQSWRLARRVGTGDVTLGADLLDVQRERLTQGADIALSRMFTPAAGGYAPVGAPALPAASADTVPALLPASAGDATTPRGHETTIPADTSGYPHDTASDQGDNPENVRPDAQGVQPATEKKPSIAADVREMVAAGVKDVRHIVDAIASRHDRRADDPRLKSTVSKYVRAAQAAAEADAQAAAPIGQYL